MTNIGTHVRTIPDEQPLKTTPLIAPPFRVPEREPVPVRRAGGDDADKKEAA